MSSLDLHKISIHQVERETGITKEVLRKWEARYSFPRPVRMATGDRLYSLDDVQRLRAIMRLLDRGFRPSKVVGLTSTELKDLLAKQGKKELPEPAKTLAKEVVAMLTNGDAAGLTQVIEKAYLSHGLIVFVQETLPLLIGDIGDKWEDGHIAIYQEHLFSEVLRSVLQHYSSRLPITQNCVRVLMGTPSDELHGMGLTMLEAVLRAVGAQCINLGSQVPVSELINGANNYRADIVAISFSLAYPSRSISPFILNLRNRLPSHISLWVGGAGVERLRSSWPGVTSFKDLGNAAKAVAEMQRTPDRSLSQ